ncbi:hypothetical protein BDB01DRAFT_469065 [Pilobolus umbonatus]|nr:hypothetical protein BDB01DRAFT_469065 [Pilobolus umbonatus]
MCLFIEFQFIFSPYLSLYFIPNPLLDSINNKPKGFNKQTIYALPVYTVKTKCEYTIPYDQLSQLISTHWQYDHLDTILNGIYRTISQEIENHITLHIQQTTNDELMDFEILQAQISGAIQAHTESNLPLAWDTASLSRSSLELFIQQRTIVYCTESIHSSCLSEHADTLSAEFNQYILTHLEESIDRLDNEILPDLLQSTVNDLSHVIDYFNRLFLPNKQLYLDITPWKAHTLFGLLLPLITQSVIHDHQLTEFYVDC